MTPDTDVMAERIRAGELEAPAAVSGTPLVRGSRKSVKVHPIFLGALWDQELDDPVPEIGAIAGGGALLYAGTDHALIGPSGSGKTYVALHLVDEVAADPGSLVLFIDYESNVNRLVSRLQGMGVTKDQGSRIAYLRANGPLMYQSFYGASLFTWIEEYKPTLVVIDSVGVAMSASNLEENSNDDATGWWYGAIHPLNLLGITSLRIDHTGKDQLGKANIEARGASAKRDRIDGIAYYLKTTLPWTQDSSGAAELVVLKDRGGTYAMGQKVARVDVTVDPLSEASRVLISLEAIKPIGRNIDGTVRRTGLMAKVSRTLEEMGTLSGNALRRAVGGKTTLVLSALEALVHEGYVKCEDGARNAKLYTLEREYVESADPLSDRYREVRDLDSTGFEGVF